jgi:hypothetical protein
MPDFGIFRGFNDKLFGDKLYAGQLPTQLGLIGSENFGFIGLLDDYPNAAAAYSLRKLRIAYTGSAIRVRRASDNTEQNIGFVDNVLDTSSLTSFCSGTNGFVTTWYDQSVNGYDATQSTAANQPQIVSGGSVILENGKPTIDHTSTQELKISADLNLLKIYSMFGVVKFDSYQKEIFGSVTPGVQGSYGIYQDVNISYHAASSAFGFSNVGFGLNFALLSIYRNNTQSISMYKNTSILGASFNIINNNNFIFRSLSGEGNPVNLDGKLSEAIIYATNEFSNQTGLENNIKTYYGL